jgi:peptidoglycan hydrolase-like protein with peptidoglycan-binding domain
VGFIVGVSATAIVLVNVLFLQPGPHPAPLVKSGVLSTAPATPGPALASARSKQIETVSPKTQLTKAEQNKVIVPTPAAPPAAARPAVEIVADIQRELSRRGFFDGVVDGRYGPRTDSAIRDFEQAAGLRPSGQPNEELLRAIARSPIRARPAPAGARKQSAASRPDLIGEMLTPSNRVMAVQRALSEFGYGQINPTGFVDGETQGAIERFERERRLPVTGQLSHRVVRELASITGRPLE